MHTARRNFLKGGALVVAFSFSGLPFGMASGAETAPAKRMVNPKRLDAFLAVRKDGSVIVYSGKVDLGTGHRIVMRQMVAEELGIPVARIALIEGDTYLTPDQGPTAGSTGVARGGVQLRQAAATAREALIALAAARLHRERSDLAISGGVVRSADGAARVGIGELVGDRPFGVDMNPKAPLKSPAGYQIVGRPLPRPDLPFKITGRHVYVHDHAVRGMLHGRVVRPPAVAAKLLGVDERSISHLPGVRVVRIQDFLGVVAADEWAAIRGARELKAEWSEPHALMGSDQVYDWAKRGPFVKEERLLGKGDTSQLAKRGDVLSAEYRWPIQSHASMGPSCAVADVRADRAVIWSASQATHRWVTPYAAMLGLPAENVRVVYLDGSGCYGMNGHDDAAADAALLSKAAGRPVRVQWTREDELGWDPKGPPQVIAIRGALDPEGHIAAWETDLWLPLATANLAHVPLLAPAAAGLPEPVGQSTGMISQNGNPPYRAENVRVNVHWLDSAPLRPSNIRAPGKVANCFAVESFVDELAARAQIDALDFRMRGLADARGIEVLERCAKLFAWNRRSSPQRAPREGGVVTGRGLAYVHYKNNENYVATAMEVEVDLKSGVIRVKKVACAHDCGLMINPDTVRSQVEGSILQTLSRALHEETRFDDSRVTSTDWASYPILRFPEVPDIAVDLIDRRSEPPMGAGEASCAPVAAALANAVFDATGVRLRTAPFTPARMLAALPAN